MIIAHTRKYNIVEIYFAPEDIDGRSIKIGKHVDAKGRIGDLEMEILYKSGEIILFKKDHMESQKTTLIAKIGEKYFSGLSKGNVYICMDHVQTFLNRTDRIKDSELFNYKILKELLYTNEQILRSKDIGIPR